MNQQEYAEVSIKDLFLTIVKHWRSLVIAILICAILAGGYGYYLHAQSLKPATKADLTSYENSMTSEELTSVKDAINIINTYRERYNSQVAYNENSIFQRLDPFAIKTVVLDYYVDNHYQVSYPVIEGNNNLVAILQTYASIFSGEDLYEKMTNEIDSSILPSYFSEVVKVDTEQQEFGTFKVTIYAHDDDVLANMCDIVVDTLNEKSSDVIETYGDHELILTSRAVQTTIDPEMYALQQENLSNVAVITKSIKEIESSYSGTQLEYLKASVHETREDSVSIKKYIVFGAVIGLILMVVIYASQYIFTKTIKTPREIVRTYDIKLIGEFERSNLSKEKKLKFDKWLRGFDNRSYDKCSHEANVELVSEKILLSMLEKGYNKLAFVISPTMIDGYEFIGEISKKLDGVSIKVLKNIETDAKSYGELSEVDAAILIESILGNSNRTMLRGEVYTCRELGKDIIGVIAVD